MPPPKRMARQAMLLGSEWKQFFMGSTSCSPPPPAAAAAGAAASSRRGGLGAVSAALLLLEGRTRRLGLSDRLFRRARTATESPGRVAPFETLGALRRSPLAAPRSRAPLDLPPRSRRAAAGRSPCREIVGGPLHRLPQVWPAPRRHPRSAPRSRRRPRRLSRHRRPDAALCWPPPPRACPPTAPAASVLANGVRIPIADRRRLRRSGRGRC